MSEYYPSHRIIQAEINGLFAQNSQPSLELESAQWEKYLKIYNSLHKEKQNRNNAMNQAFTMVIRWASMPKTSPEYLQMVEMLKMVHGIAGQSIPNDTDSMEVYQKTNMKILKDTIELYKKYSDIIHEVERKKFEYALKFRGLDRLDIPAPERFGKQDVADYLNSMIAIRDSFDNNCQKLREHITRNPNDRVIEQAVNMSIQFFEREKINYLNEVEYYQNLCAELDVAGYRK